MWAIIATTVWWVTGYYLVIYLAGLQHIPRDFYEAAAIDGAGAIRSFWAITLPLLRPVLLFVFVTHMIGSFQIFGQVFVLTQGGPGDATGTVVQHLYETAFQNLFSSGRPRRWRGCCSRSSWSFPSCSSASCAATRSTEWATGRWMARAGRGERRRGAARPCPFRPHRSTSVNRSGASPAGSRWGAQTRRVDVPGVLLTAALLALAALWLLPAVWVLVTSSSPPRTSSGCRRSGSRGRRRRHYHEVLFSSSRTARIGRAFVNSLVVAVGTVAIVLLTSAMAAYPLARMRFPGAISCSPSWWGA